MNMSFDNSDKKQCQSDVDLSCHQWYALKVYSGQEEGICGRIIDKTKIDSDFATRISNAVVPYTEYLTVRAGKERKVKKVVWPGYVLVKMYFDDSVRAGLKSVRGVFDFIGDSMPTPISDSEIQNILSLQAANNTELHNSEFKEGDNVIIAYGPLIKTPAKIVKILNDRKKARVEISMFGRSTYLDLDWDQIESE